MTDREMAKELLEKELYACVMVKDQQVVYTSKARGIYPLYEAKEILGLDFKGAFLADKVIGKAAAMIAVEGGVAGIYGEVMSQHALDFIDSKGIFREYGRQTPFIKNRELDGMCPVETRAITTDRYDELVQRVEAFLASVDMKIMHNTLVIIKPDAFSKGKVGQILSVYEQEGFRIVAARVAEGEGSTLRAHYAEHRGKPFYASLLEFMGSGPMLVLILRGLDGIERVRQLNGDTDPLKAAKGTIRRIYGQDIQKNAVHGSATPADALREIEIWFPHRKKEENSQ